MGPLVAGAHNVSVVLTQVGRAAVAADVPTLDHTLSAAVLHPLVCSMRGGAVLRITGSGFSPVAHENVVRIRGALCHVITADYTELQCRVPPLGNFVVDLPHGASVDASTSRVV